MGTDGYEYEMEEAEEFVLDAPVRHKIRKGKRGAGKQTYDKEIFPVTMSAGREVTRHLHPSELGVCKTTLNKNHPSAVGGGKALSALLGCIPEDTMTLPDLIQITKESSPTLSTDLKHLLEDLQVNCETNCRVSKHYDNIKKAFCTTYPVKAETITNLDTTPMKGETGAVLAKRLEHTVRDMTAETTGDCSLYMSILMQTLRGQITFEGLARIEHLDPGSEGYLFALCTLRVREEEKRQKKQENANTARMEDIAKSSIESTKAISKLCKQLAKSAIAI